MLRELTIADLDAYYALVDRNRAHLNRFGNYGFELDATIDDVRAYFEAPWDYDVRFGIWLDDELVGRVDLNPVNPPHWVLGYWLDEGHVGRGIVTEAARDAIDHVRSLGATELYAGVTHGNERSIAVLRRLGFEHVEDLDDRSRWKLVLV